MLDVIESLEFLKNFEIADFLIINNEKDLIKAAEKFSFPLYLKISSPEHKLRLGGVKRADSIEELKKYYKELKNNFPKNKIIAQKSIDGEEIIIGVKEDAIFGKILMLGAGGTLTELTKDISFRACPLEKSGIAEMMEELKLGKKLTQDMKNKIIEIAEKISMLDVKELDINPLIVNKKEAVIVDARIEL